MCRHIKAYSIFVTLCWICQLKKGEIEKEIKIESVIQNCPSSKMLPYYRNLTFWTENHFYCNAKMKKNTDF